MYRVIAGVLLALVTAFTHAGEFEDADKAWTTGKPWPAHWGLVQYPYTEAWNVVLMGYVNKVYDKDEAADTWLKSIPSTMQKGASVEVCMMKRGLLELASFCKPAVVDAEIVGTLKQDDVVAFFYPNHGTKRFSSGPGSDPRTTLRVFQKIASGDDKSCWIREKLVFKRPLADSCFAKIDRSLITHILTRDFGPREGGTLPAQNIVVDASVKESDAAKPQPVIGPKNQDDDAASVNAGNESAEKL